MPNFECHDKTYSGDYKNLPVNMAKLTGYSRSTVKKMLLKNMNLTVQCVNYNALNSTVRNSSIVYTIRQYINGLMDLQ